MVTEVIRVVHAEQVEAHTQNGWKLTEILDAASEIAPSVMTPGYNGPNGVWVPGQPSPAFAIVRPLFVLRKDAETLTREQVLEGKLDALSKRVTEAERAAEKLAKVESQKAGFESDLGNLRRTLAEMVASAAEHTKLLQRIRREIGEAKWRELEGSHTSCILCIEAQR